MRLLEVVNAYVKDEVDVKTRFNGVDISNRRSTHLDCLPKCGYLHPTDPFFRAILLGVILCET